VIYFDIRILAIKFLCKRAIETRNLQRACKFILICDS
jgi:hypothetical protein